MSIANAIILPECGYLCADTEAGPDGGPYSEVSKMIVLPHLNAIAAFRGHLIFFGGAASGMVVAPGSFDDLPSYLPGILKTAADKAMEISSRYCQDFTAKELEKFGCGEAVIVGYSPARSRVVGYQFRRDSPDQDFQGGETSYLVAPGWRDVDLGLQELRTTPNKDGMRRLALTQLRLIRERERAGVAAGGRLLYAEVRRNHLTIESIMNFPPRPGAVSPSR